MLSGLLNLNKPVGVTSRWVVDLVQDLVRPAKAGHAGTLDPLASGVLIVCVGQGTRLVEYLQRLPKRYTGTFLLGRESDTEDIQGAVQMLDNPRVPSREEIEAAAASLRGPILQRPPAFSALKVKGRRAYAVARGGGEVELQPRPVTIHRLDVVRYEYPELVLDIECSSGTYVRSVGRDLAQKAGTAAVMSALVRTAIGSFTLADAISPDSLTLHNLLEHLLPLERAVEALPRVTLSQSQAQRIALGQFIELDSNVDELAALDAGGHLLAILARRADGKFGAEKNFAAWQS